MSKSARPPVPAPFADRIARVRATMTAKRIDGYLAQDEHDQYWLTGFTGEDGAVLVTQRSIVLITDGRFDETADIEAPYARKVVRKKRGPESIASEVARERVARLGFDPTRTTVSDLAGLRKAADDVRWTPASGVISQERVCKDAGEIERIRAAIHIAEAAFLQMLGWLRPGMTERDAAARLVYDMACLGADSPSFAPIVASGPNASLPHYRAGGRTIREGELLLVDWGARARGYVSDLTRVIPIGSIPARLSEITRIVREAHDRAVAVVGPGVKASQVDAAARRHIDKSPYAKRFTHSVGHGMGLAVHEGPGLRKSGGDVLRPGMVVTIEPGIYLPGDCGARIESDVLVTESGYEILSQLPREVQLGEDWASQTVRARPTPGHPGIASSRNPAPAPGL